MEKERTSPRSSSPEAPGGQPQDFHAFGAEDLIEAAGELLSRSRRRNLAFTAPSCSFQARFGANRTDAAGTTAQVALLMPVLPDQELDDPDNGVGQNDQHYKLYDEIRGMKVEWHDHKIARLGAVSMSVAIRVEHVDSVATLWDTAAFELAVDVASKQVGGAILSLRACD